MNLKQKNFHSQRYPRDFNRLCGKVKKELRKEGKKPFYGKGLCFCGGVEVHRLTECIFGSGHSFEFFS